MPLALETIRDRLLLPPQRYSGHPFHSTIAHPRTSTDPAGCDAKDLNELRLAHPALRTVALEALDGAARTSITPA